MSAASVIGGLNPFSSTSQSLAQGIRQLATGSHAIDPKNLRRDPITGNYYDSSNGNVYSMNPDGTYQPIREPGMRSQVLKNLETGDQYTGLATTYNTALQGTMAQQQGLADAYKRTIEDPNAPSVAREQLNQALQANEATQLSGAAGASGANAFIARRNAANNIAGLNAQEGQAAAAVRAGEVATAQKGLADTYNSLGTEAAGGATMNTNAGLGFGTLAGNLETAANSNETTKSGQNKALAADVIKDASAGLSGATKPTPGGP